MSTPLSVRGVSAGGRMKRRRFRRAGIPVLGVLIGAIAWEVIGRNTAATFFAPLSTTLSNLVSNLADGTLLAALGTSLSVYAAGLAVGVALGGLAGIALARSRLLGDALTPYATALYATPVVALIPFILTTVGFGFVPKQLVVFLFVVFPVLLNTLEGARSVSNDLLEVARAYRSSERQLWRDLIIPYTLPYTMTGVRQGLARGLVGVIVAEFFLSQSGLGQMIIVASNRFDSPTVLSTTLVVTLLGLVLMALGKAIEARFARWRVSG